ncbi:MAG: hypothetical protein Sapg2KO_46410 [Saprospiraceae bacterium]
MNRQTHLVLENEFVKLLPLQFYHLEALLLIAKQQPDLLKYSPSPFGDREKVELYIKAALQQRQQGNRYPFVIWSKKYQRIVGSTSYGNIALAHQRLEIGWTWIEKTVQGTGLNQQCKFLLLSYAFEKLNLERVEFKIDDRNEASKKAVLKIGGQKEGTLRSHTLMRDGFRRDTTYFGILKTDWPDHKNKIFNGFKLFPSQQQPFQETLRLSPLKGTKTAPMDLLSLADPDESSIKKYISKSETWLVYQEDYLLGCCLVLRKGSRASIENIAIYPTYQGLGIGQYLLQNIIEIYTKQGVQELQIATANTSVGQLYLYQKMGFSIQEINKNHFVKNNTQPLMENGLEVKDQIVLALYC